MLASIILLMRQLDAYYKSMEVDEIVYNELLKIIDQMRFW